MSDPHSTHQPAGSRTQAQNKRLWCLVRDLERRYGAGKGKLIMRRIVREVSGGDCTRILTAAQMARVLDRLAAEAGEAPRPARPTPPRVPRPLDLPSPGQQQLIDSLFTGLGWWQTERRVAFAKTLCEGRPWPQTKAEANKLIEALKAMTARKYDRRTPKEGP